MTTTPRLSRRSFLGAAGLGAGAVLLPGCSTDTSTSSGGKTDLTFWLPGGEDLYLQLHKELARTYGKQHGDVNVSVTRLTGEQSFLEVLLARIAGGNPPSATVLWDPPIALAVQGTLRPLDDYLSDSENCKLENWPEAVLKSCQYDGVTYGLPFTAGSYAVFYNQEWFEEKGIPADRDSFPKTWDDLRALSKEFTRWNGDKLETAGFIPPFDAVTMPIWSGLNGGQVYDAENKTYTIDSDENIEMMEYFVSWLDEEYQGDINKVNNSWVSVGGEAVPIFQEQRQAMLLDGTWMMGSFYSVEAKFERWEVASAPVGPSGDEPISGYWPNWMALPTDANDPDKAFEYLDFIAVEGAEAQFEEFPDLPTNAHVDPAIVPNKLRDRRGDAFAEDATAFFRKQLDVSVPMWDSPVHTIATDQLTRAAERISTKDSSPKDALAEAQRSCQSELEKVL